MQVQTLLKLLMVYWTIAVIVNKRTCLKLVIIRLWNLCMLCSFVITNFCFVKLIPYVAELQLLKQLFQKPNRFQGCGKLLRRAGRLLSSRRMVLSPT